MLLYCLNMGELIDMIVRPSHPDDRKGAAIEIVANGVVGLFGGGVGAKVSHTDGAFHKWNETQPSQGVPTSERAINHNLLTGVEVFGPIALGAVASIALFRKFTNFVVRE